MKHWKCTWFPWTQTSCNFLGWCVGKTLSCSKASHSSSLSGSVYATIIATTTTSVSTVHTSMWWCPCFAATFDCLPLHYCMVQVSQCPVVVAHRLPGPHLWLYQLLVFSIEWMDEYFWQETEQFCLINIHTQEVLPVFWYGYRLNNTCICEPSFSKFCAGCCF